MRMRHWFSVALLLLLFARGRLPGQRHERQCAGPCQSQAATVVAAAEQGWIVQVRRPRRLRHRRTAQYELAEQMAKLHERFKYDFVVLVGDNLYGSERPQDFAEEIRDSLQAAAGRRREVLRVAGQP